MAAPDGEHLFQEVTLRHRVLSDPIYSDAIGRKAGDVIAVGCPVITIVSGNSAWLTINDPFAEEDRVYVNQFALR